MVEIPIESVVQIVVPTALVYSVIAGGWWTSRRLAQQRQSHGLFLVSYGFLVKLIADVSWTVFYWVGLGGPFGLFALRDRGLSLNEINQILSITGWTSVAVDVASWAAMVALIIHGLSRITKSELVSVAQPM